MIRKTMTVRLNKGLEARPIAVFVQIASQHECTVHVEVEEKRVNAKSIMGMMSLVLASGKELTIVADGADEASAIEEIERFLNGEEI